MKHDVLDILDDLYNDVQGLRENGEGDMRTVAHYIDNAISEVNKLEAPKTLTKKEKLIIVSSLAFNLKSEFDIDPLTVGEGLKLGLMMQREFNLDLANVTEEEAKAVVEDMVSFFKEITDELMNEPMTI